MVRSLRVQSISLSQRLLSLFAPPLFLMSILSSHYNANRVVEEENAKKWADGFEGYKDRILAKLEDQAAKEEQMRSKRLEAAAKEREEKIARFKEKMGSR